MKIKSTLRQALKIHRLRGSYRKYREYTMVTECQFISNLGLAIQCATVEGCVVECGVWRGGMIAAISEILGPQRRYYLFDSFEGLPPAKEIDGAAAMQWQADKSSEAYHDNCRAEEDHARRALRLAGITNAQIIPGWFSVTMSKFPKREQIALLRLDGDWFESTMQCLVALYPQVAPKGLIIVDDYFTWDGCSRAIHRYLADNNCRDRLRHTPEGVCYITKSEPETNQSNSPELQPHNSQVWQTQSRQ